MLKVSENMNVTNIRSFLFWCISYQSGVSCDVRKIKRFLGTHIDVEITWAECSIPGVTRFTSAFKWSKCISTCGIFVACVFAIKALVVIWKKNTMRVDLVLILWLSKTYINPVWKFMLEVLFNRLKRFKCSGWLTTVTLQLVICRWIWLSVWA